jgi:thioredoxin-like negative regulator of GroEL
MKNRSARRRKLETKRSPRLVPIGIFVGLVSLFVVLLVLVGGGSESEARKRIAVSEKSRNALRILESWDAFAAKDPDAIRSEDLVRWARAALSADRPTKAAAVLERWLASEDRNTDGWLLLVELKRALGDSDGVSDVVAAMLQEPAARRSGPLLTAATFGLLTAMNSEDTIKRLTRWSEAEPASPLARAWLLHRFVEDGAEPAANRGDVLEQARQLVEAFPDSPDARRVAVEIFFERGMYAEISAFMGEWPNRARQSSGYQRLEGRRLLEIEKAPAAALSAFRAVLERMPQDWRTRYRLSRALAGTGDVDAAKTEARRTVEIRELLEPSSLERTLKAAFPKGKDPILTELVPLLSRIGQNDLAKAWQDWDAANRLLGRMK